MLINFEKKHVRIFEVSGLKMYWKFLGAGVVTVIIMYVIKDVIMINSLVTLCIKTTITFGCYIALLLVLRERMMWETVQRGSNYLKHKLKRDEH